MNFAFTAEQEELRTTARAFLAEHAKPEQVRAAMESELGHDPALWKRIGAELGWTAVAIPEAYGGLGLSWVEVVALQEVLGEALFCGPYFASVCLAASAIEAAGSEEQKTRLLGSIADEGAMAAVAHGAGASWRRDGSDYLLEGCLRPVVDGHCADLLVVAAGESGGAAAAGLSLFMIPSDAAGLVCVQ
ncbi:MAG: acyl-CoA dehydrogenase family protein, partial [Myxococcota bacterium]